MGGLRTALSQRPSRSHPCPGQRLRRRAAGKGGRRTEPTGRSLPAARGDGGSKPAEQKAGRSGAKGAPACPDGGGAGGCGRARGTGVSCATGSGGISGFLRLIPSWKQGQNLGRLAVPSKLDGAQTQSEGAGEARALGRGPRSPPLRRVAGGREQVVGEGAVDGAQDLPVVDDPPWRQVVPQRGPHHCVRRVLHADQTGRELRGRPGPARCAPRPRCWGAL